MRARDLLPQAAERHPDRVALEFEGGSICYGELAERAARVCAALREAGRRPGDAVAVMLPNIPEFAVIVGGSLLAGTRLVPMNVLLQPREVRYMLADSAVRCLITCPSLLPQVELALAQLDDPPHTIVVGGGQHDHTDYAAWTATAPTAADLPELPANAPVLTLYTSGTTGEPKGAVITDANLMAQLRMIRGAFPPVDGDRYLVALPLFHVFALNALLLPAFYHDATVVLHARFETEATIQSLVEDRITVFAGVPTMYFYILGHPDLDDREFPHLRYGVSGGAPLPVEVLRGFEERFGVPVYEGYGLTETTVSVCTNRPGLERRPGKVGKPYDAVQMKVVDDHGREVALGEVGEIVIKGPNVMHGYFGKPEATAEALIDGWLHTGDLGRCDEDGYFTIVDRLKDMILVAGYNVYPREIEEVIYELPEVGEVAVIGIPDRARGELVRAVVAPKRGQYLSEQALRSYLETEVASYKLPHDYVFLDELPKGSTGKILKRALREQLSESPPSTDPRAEQA